MIFVRRVCRNAYIGCNPYVSAVGVDLKNLYYLLWRTNVYPIRPIRVCPSLADAYNEFVTDLQRHFCLFLGIDIITDLSGTCIIVMKFYVQGIISLFLACNDVYIITDNNIIRAYNKVIAAVNNVILTDDYIVFSVNIPLLAKAAALGSVLINLI